MLQVEGVTKRYGSFAAVNQVSLTLQGGKIYELLGPNGSGKSTLMKMIAGLIEPTEGSISLTDVGVEDGPLHPITWRDKANIAYMPTESYFYQYMTGVQIGKYYKDFFKDFDYEKYIGLLGQMNLDPKKKAAEMSTGMLAKLKIAVNLARTPKVLMLDEPLNGVDIIARDLIIRTIKENISPETAVVMSSHLVDELEDMVDYVVFLKSGEVVLQGNADQIREERGKSTVDLYREIYAEVAQTC